MQTKTHPDRTKKRENKQTHLRIDELRCILFLFWCLFPVLDEPTAAADDEISFIIDEKDPLTMFVAASNSTTPSTYIVAAATAAATANVTPTPPVTNGGMETATATGTPALSDIKLICTRRKKVRSSGKDREAAANWPDVLCSLENQTSYLCHVRRKSSISLSQ